MAHMIDGGRLCGHFTGWRTPVHLVHRQKNTSIEKLMGWYVLHPRFSSCVYNGTELDGINTRNVYLDQ